MLLLFKLLLMGAVLTGGLKAYADIPLLNENPLLSGVGGIVCLVALLFVFPKLIGFVFKFALFTIAILGLCNLCGVDFNSIIKKLSSVDISPLLEDAVPAEKTEPVSGHVSAVLSGKSFVFNGENVQLYGIDTPDIGQKCTASNGLNYACGEQAAVELNALVKEKKVECVLSAENKNDARMATCTVDGDDVAALMVRNGWAIADATQTDKYAEEEESAYARRMGMWTGHFQEPRKWRQNRNAKKHKQTKKASVSSNTKSDTSVWQKMKSLFGADND